MTFHLGWKMCAFLATSSLISAVARASEGDSWLAALSAFAAGGMFLMAFEAADESRRKKADQEAFARWMDARTKSLGRCSGCGIDGGNVHTCATCAAVRSAAARKAATA